MAGNDTDKNFSAQKYEIFRNFMYFCSAFGNALVVQLNRMSDSGSEDRGFESRRGHHLPLKGGFLLDFHSPMALAFLQAKSSAAA